MNFYWHARHPQNSFEKKKIKEKAMYYSIKNTIIILFW